MSLSLLFENDAARDICSNQPNHLIQYGLRSRNSFLIA